MKEDPKCPQGCRFLIQIVDAVTKEDAKERIAKIFSQACADVATYVSGTNRPMKKRTFTGGEAWAPSPVGFRVYIPKNFHI